MLPIMKKHGQWRMGNTTRRLNATKEWQGKWFFNARYVESMATTQLCATWIMEIKMCAAFVGNVDITTELVLGPRSLMVWVSRMLRKTTIPTIWMWGIRTNLGGAPMSYNQMHLWILQGKPTFLHSSNNTRGNSINNKVGVKTMMMILMAPYSNH